MTGAILAASIHAGSWAIVCIAMLGRLQNDAQTISQGELSMAIISRGFSGRRRAEDEKLPPGQYVTTDFPVLSAGPTPRVPLDQWEFTINDGTKEMPRWDWKAFRELPTETFTVDIHCVTRWSKFGTTWEGVSLDTLLADVKTDASY